MISGTRLDCPLISRGVSILARPAAIVILLRTEISGTLNPWFSSVLLERLDIWAWSRIPHLLSVAHRPSYPDLIGPAEDRDLPLVPGQVHSKHWHINRRQSSYAFTLDRAICCTSFYIPECRDQFSVGCESPRSTKLRCLGPRDRLKITCSRVRAYQDSLDAAILQLCCMSSVKLISNSLQVSLSLTIVNRKCQDPHFGRVFRGFGRATTNWSFPGSFGKREAM